MMTRKSMSTSTGHWLPVLIAAVAFVSCATPRYVYSPTRTTGAEISGATAASYPVPPESPRGSVRLAIFGIAPLDPASDGAVSSSRAIHMSLVVANRSDETWTIVPAEQRLELMADEELDTVYPAGTQPPVGIPPRTTRRVNLFFPLPAGLENASELPALNAVWVVHAGSRVVTQRTPFERFRAGPIVPPPMPPSSPSEW